jgi:hypothetical protein
MVLPRAVTNASSANAPRRSVFCDGTVNWRVTICSIVCTPSDALVRVERPIVDR